MRFEWNENKRAANADKHGLDLLDGAELFDGRPCYSYLSPRRGESRIVTIASLRDVLVALVWTERNDAKRLISLRRARREERREHHARFG